MARNKKNKNIANAQPVAYAPRVGFMMPTPNGKPIPTPTPASYVQVSTVFQNVAINTYSVNSGASSYDSYQDESDDYLE